MNEGKKKFFRVEIQGEVQEKEHFHQNLELLYILDGCLTLTVENEMRKLEREDIFLVNTGKKHSCHGMANMLFVRVMIDYTRVSEILERKI